MQVTRSDGGLAVETPRLRLAVAPEALRWQLRSRQHPLALSGLFPHATVAGGARTATAGRFVGTTSVETPCGAATRFELRDRGSPLDLVLRLELADDWPGLVLELALEHTGDEPLAVHALDPLCWERSSGALELPGATGGLRFFRLGYQSWSPAAWLPLSGVDARGRLDFLRRMHFGPESPLPRRGRHVSDWATELRAPGEPGLALGFLTHRRWFTHVQLEHGGGRAAGLRARCATEGRPLLPGESLRSERLWLGLYGRGEDGLADWAARSGRELEAPVPAPVGSGWCSWYHFFTRVTAEDVRRNVRALAPYRGQLETVQIDDGFQACVGDWLEPHADFPDGVEPLAREIRDAGFRAGLWLAPFLVSRAARVAREHPDWLLRDARERPVVANYNPAWRGRVCYALDLTRAPVRAWLAEVFAQVRAWGFDYLKLDFLYAGLVRGRRSDVGTTPVEAYRRTLAELRRAAGPEPFFVGCGAPLGPSIGLFEAMRIGPDVAPAWRAPRSDWLLGLPAAPAAGNSIRNVLARASLHQRLWLNDPDCVLLRERATALDENEVRTLASAVAISGGMVLASDDMQAVGPERAALLRRLLPPLQQPPRSLPGDGPVPDLLWQELADGSALVLRVNLTDESRPLPVEPAALGLSGPVHVWDAWQERYLGVVAEGPVPGDPLPPPGCRLLRLLPVSQGPAVLGSGIHLAGGALEVAALRSGEAGETRAVLRLPGPRAGPLVIQPSAGPPVQLRVAFEGETEVSVWSPRT